MLCFLRVIKWTIRDIIWLSSLFNVLCYIGNFIRFRQFYFPVSFDCCKSNWISENAFNDWMSPFATNFASDSFHGAKQFSIQLFWMVGNVRRCEGMRIQNAHPDLAGSWMKRAISGGISKHSVLVTIFVKCKETFERNSPNQNGRYSFAEGVDSSVRCSSECVGPDGPVWTSVSCPWVSSIELNSIEPKQKRIGLKPRSEAKLASTRGRNVFNLRSWMFQHIVIGFSFGTCH